MPRIAVLAVPILRIAARPTVGARLPARAANQLADLKREIASEIKNEMKANMGAIRTLLERGDNRMGWGQTRGDDAAEEKTDTGDAVKDKEGAGGLVSYETIDLRCSAGGQERDDAAMEDEKDESTVVSPGSVVSSSTTAGRKVATCADTAANAV